METGQVHGGDTSHLILLFLCEAFKLCYHHDYNSCIF